MIGSWSGRNFLELDSSISYSTLQFMRSTCGKFNLKDWKMKNETLSMQNSGSLNNNLVYLKRRPWNQKAEEE